MAFNELAMMARHVASPKQCKKKLPSLIFMTDRQKIPNPLPIIARLPANTLVIIRDYDHPNRAIYCRDIINCAKKRFCKVVIAGDASLALKLSADGVHMPEYQWQNIRALKRKYPLWLITVAAHSSRAIKAINSTKADAVLVSPLFHTTSHKGARPLTKHAFNTISLQCQLPIYALGGISLKKSKTLYSLSIKGIAAIDAFK